MSEPTFPLSMPTNRNFVKSKFILKRAVAVTKSPFTFATQSAKFTGCQWCATVSLPPLSRSEASEWQAFFAQLNGNFGTFLMGDPDALSTQGAMTNTIKVKTDASIGSFDVEIKDGNTSVTDALKKGDYVQFGSAGTSKLHILVADVDTDGSGDGTLQIEPPLKSAVLADDVVTYASPKCVMRMQTADLSWDADQASRFGISFACEEAI